MKPEFETISDDGRWIIYREFVPQGRIKLVDLQTQYQQPLHLERGNAGFISFITPTLLIFTIPSREIAPSYAIYDVTTKRLTELTTVDLWRDPLTEELQELLGRATMVRVIIDGIVILVGGSDNYAVESVVIYTGDLRRLEELRAQLDMLHISYVVDPVFHRPIVTPDAVFSSDGRLSATSAGIERRDTGAVMRAIPSTWRNFDPPWLPDNWVLDDRAVVYRRIQTTVANLGMWAAVAKDWLVVPQPILLLPVEI